MTFDDVSVPAVVFVIVMTVLAVVGNCLVLLVFGCRWRSTNDTKVYIMTLAVLDLLCVTLSSPRDLITLLPASQCMLRTPAMDAYCRLSVFFTNHLNVASALILVAIAASRFFKVTKKDSNSSTTTTTSKTPRGAGAKGKRTSLKRLLRGVSTVRGAKIASGMAVALAFLQCCPALVLYGSGGEQGRDGDRDGDYQGRRHFQGPGSFSSESLNQGSSSVSSSSSSSSSSSNVSGTFLTLEVLGSQNRSSSTSFPWNQNVTDITSTLKSYYYHSTTSDYNNTTTNIITNTTTEVCYASCRDDIKPGFRQFRTLFDISQFSMFALLTLFMIGIYGAILSKLCCAKSRQGTEYEWELQEQQQQLGGREMDGSFISLDLASSSALIQRKVPCDGKKEKEGESGKKREDEKKGEESEQCPLGDVSSEGGGGAKNSSPSSSCVAPPPKVESARNNGGGGEGGGNNGVESEPISPSADSGLCLIVEEEEGKEQEENGASPTTTTTTTTTPGKGFTTPDSQIHREPEPHHKPELEPELQVQTRNNKHLDFSMSSSSEQSSRMALTRQTSQGQGYGGDLYYNTTSSSNRLSTASFTLTKTGNRARLTTLVFLMVTSIYIVSYFPYFLSLLYEHLVDAGMEKPWSQWSARSLAAMKIWRRSYLIANAANPIVYGLCNPYFREQLGKLLICRRDVI